MICPRCSRAVPDDAILCCYCGRTIVRQKPAHAHQRPNGSGYAYRRGKTWTAVYTPEWRTDEDGKRHRVRVTKGGFKLKSDALEYCAILKNGGVKKKAPSLQHYWDLYLNNEYTKLSQSKQMAYRIAWNKCAAIRFKPVDAITVSDIRMAVSQKAPTYYPARDMKVLLGHLFDLAGADRWVDKDLPDFIILPDLNEKERQPFTEEEQAALWRVYDAGNRTAALPLIMIYTGMMPGEMQALKLDMIDLDHQRIVGGGMKTKVRRASPVFLPDAIIPILAEEMQASTSKVGYVWPHNERSFYDRYYAALEAAGCRRLEPYSCRHTTATALAITENIAPQTIKKIMRWSSTKMLDTYAHPTDKDAMAAINRITPADNKSASDTDAEPER